MFMMLSFQDKSLSLEKNVIDRASKSITFLWYLLYVAKIPTSQITSLS